MPSRQRERAYVTRLDLDFDHNEREKEVMNLIEMSVEALLYLDTDDEGGKKNMAKFLADEAITHAMCLSNEISYNAYLQRAYCCWALSEWAEASMALEAAKKLHQDAWTSEEETLLNRSLKLERAAREREELAARERNKE